MSKKVTLATIAHTCGISVGTVSRALSEKPDINPETKARVLETAAQLGYQKFNGDGPTARNCESASSIARKARSFTNG